MEQIFNSIFSILPSSPFTSFLDNFESIPYLGWLNWFIPVGACVKVATVWGTAILGYYAVQFIIKQIGNISLFKGGST